MIVDHVGGASWLRLITGGNMFIVSAAEFFVFVSGWVGGMVWSGITRSRGFGSATLKIIKRAVILYTLTVLLSLSFGAFSFYFNLPWATDIASIDRSAFVQNSVTLRQTLPFVDILLLYTLLFAAAPFALILLYTGRPFWLIAASVLIWLEFQIWGIQIPWQIPDYGFQFAAWQLLFFGAMAIGFHQRNLAKYFARVYPALWWPVAFALLLGMIALYGRALDMIGGGGTLATSAPFLKSQLAIGRVGAFALAFPLVFLTVHFLWKPVQFLTGWLFLPLGRNALLSYTLHVVLVALAAVSLPADWSASPDVSTFVQTIAVLVIWGLSQTRDHRPEKQPADQSTGRIRMLRDPAIGSSDQAQQRRNSARTR
jgi:hypothetical protein